MPNINPNTRVSAEQTQANVEAYLALKKIPDYVPINPEHSVEAATLCYEELLAAEEALIHADNTAAAARDTVRRARWKLQNVIVGAKGEVKVRYGLDSNEVAAIGLKKKSERSKASKASNVGSKPRRDPMNASTASARLVPTKLPIAM